MVHSIARTLDLAHRYERFNAIAAGGMGTVYLGRMIAGDAARPVAIKVLHPHLAENANMVAMFLDEARVATRLRHPNIVGVLDMDRLGNELVIVMEYIEGLSMSWLMRRLEAEAEKLPVGVAVRILLDALEGLQAAHDLADDDGKLLGLVHRDVSPDNLLVGSDGVTRVTDFGVALVSGRLASTAPGTVKGKVKYLAPEQLSGKKLDRRVDVFAAGIVLWEALTGKDLFDAATEAEVVNRVLCHPILPPSLQRSEVSTELDEVCLHALERDPDRRFKTAAEFAAALRKAVKDIPAHAEVGALVSEVASETIQKHRATLEQVTQRPPRPPSPSLVSVREAASRPSGYWLRAGVVSLIVAAAAFAFARAPRGSAAQPQTPAANAGGATEPPTASVAVPVVKPLPGEPATSAAARNDGPGPGAAERVDAGARPAPRKGASAKGGGARPFMPQDL